VSTSIFAGNNNGNSVDILSPPSFLLARDPYAKCLWDARTRRHYLRSVAGRRAFSSK